jgi:hypothetical protein
MRGCNSFVLQCKHLVSADGLQEIEDSIGKLYRDASQNEIIKTIFGMFMIMNHKRLQKTMLIAHAMTYALPSLKYSFNNLVAYYKKNRKEMKSELPRIRRVSMDKSKLLDKLSKINKEYKIMRKQYRQGTMREDRFEKLSNTYYEDVKKIKTALKEIRFLNNVVPHVISCLNAQHVMDMSSSLLLAGALGVSSWKNDKISILLKGSTLGRVVFERVMHVCEHFKKYWFSPRVDKDGIDVVTWLRANGIMLSRALGFYFAANLVPSQKMAGWLTTCTVGSYLICEGFEELLDPYLERRNHPFLKKPTDVLALQQALVALGTSDEILSGGVKELVLITIFVPLLAVEKLLFRDKSSE